MEKVTSSLQTSKKKVFLTPTVKRLTASNVLFFLILLLAINVLFIFIVVFILHSGIDKQLSHEMDKIIETLDIKGNKVLVKDYSELNEPDFNSVSDVSMFLQIYNNDRQLLISSSNLNEYNSIPMEFDVKKHEFIFKDMNIGEDRLRIGYRPLYNEDGTQVAILQLATFENELFLIRNKMIVFNLIFLPVLIIIVVIVSIFIAKRSFKPVNKIIETAETISAKNLNAKIEYETKPGDELGRLRDTLNGLFDRIKSYINQLSQFTDHASHQMMNPLTAVKTELEYILRKERSDCEYKDALNKLLIQTDQLIKIVRTLLMISKQDNKNQNNQSIFNYGSLIRRIFNNEFARENIECSIESEVYIRGDEDKFYIIIENLLDNAIKYSDDGKTVSISLAKKNSSAILLVKDNGIGISDSDKQKVFDRFYRSETAEKLGIKGYGLGLSLVKLLIEEAGGSITITDNNPKGTIITVNLPYVTLT